jgi:serine/threonine protein kinase
LNGIGALSHLYPRPQVKICGFGLPKVISNSATTLDPATSSACTLEYSSPERLLRGRRSKQDDVYAFGILMYFIATSRTPYSDISSEDVETVVKKGTRPNIDEWEEGGEYIPETIEGVVRPFCELSRQCWHEKAAQRPALEYICGRLAALAALV